MVKKTQTTHGLTTALLVMTMGIAPMLGACSPTDPPFEGGPTSMAEDGGTASSSSEAPLPAGSPTKDGDREWWTSVSDESGHIIANVVDITPPQGVLMDYEGLLRWLSDAKGILWTHVIVGDNMATQEVEHAYLHLSRDSDAGQVVSAAQRLANAGWKAKVMTVDEYQHYLDSVDTTGMSYSETTYLGNTAM